MQTTSYLVGEKSKMMWGKSRVEGKRKKKGYKKERMKRKIGERKEEKMTANNKPWFLLAFFFIYKRVIRATIM